MVLSLPTISMSAFFGALESNSMPFVQQNQLAVVMSGARVVRLTAGYANEEDIFEYVGENGINAQLVDRVTRNTLTISIEEFRDQFKLIK